MRGRIPSPRADADAGVSNLKMTNVFSTAAIAVMGCGGWKVVGGRCPKKVHKPTSKAPALPCPPRTRNSHNGTCETNPVASVLEFGS